jgi:putative peptidoglycan lipid II flippase
MVKKALAMLNKEFSNINHAALVLGFFTLLSQILALFRDRMFAHFLGPSTTLDVYYASFKIPDLLFVSVASLASVTVLLPFLVQKLGVKENGEINESNESGRKLVNDVFTVFLGAMVVIALILFFLMPHIAPLVAPGFSQAQMKELVGISRIMLISPILLGLSNTLGSVTQMFKKFFVFALSPVFYNIGIIIGIVFLYPIFGLKGLAIGVVFGALLHLLIQYPVLHKKRFIPKFSFSVDWREIGRMTALSFPRTFGLALTSFSILIIISIASKIGVGSISLFQFSYNLQNVPLGIIGVSYAVAAFPTLARFFSRDSMEEFVAYISVAARQIIFWSMPIMFLFIVLRAQIVRVILGSGAFSWDDTRLTAAALALFSISIVGQSLILLFTRGYYAAGNTKKPLLINFVSTIITIILSYILVSLFNKVHGMHYFFEALLRIETIPHTEIVMLPLAFSIGNIINGLWIWLAFRRDFRVKNAFILKSFCQSFAGGFFMGYTAYICLNMFDNIFNINRFWGVLGQGFFSGVIGIVVGILVLKILKNEELENVWQSLKSKKLFRTKPVSSGQEEVQ